MGDGGKVAAAKSPNRTGCTTVELLDCIMILNSSKLSSPLPSARWGGIGARPNEQQEWLAANLLASRGGPGRRAGSEGGLPVSATWMSSSASASSISTPSLVRSCLACAGAESEPG